MTRLQGNSRSWKLSLQDTWQRQGEGIWSSRGVVSTDSKPYVFLSLFFGGWESWSFCHRSDKREIACGGGFFIYFLCVWNLNFSPNNLEENKVAWKSNRFVLQKLLRKMWFCSRVSILLKDVLFFFSWWCGCPNDGSRGCVIMEFPWEVWWRLGWVLAQLIRSVVTTPLFRCFFAARTAKLQGLCKFLEECRVIRRFHDWNYPTNSEVIITMAMIPVAFKSTRIPTSSFELWSWWGI